MILTNKKPRGKKKKSTEQTACWKLLQITEGSDEERRLFETRKWRQLHEEQQPRLEPPVLPSTPGSGPGRCSQLQRP